MDSSIPTPFGLLGALDAAERSFTRQHPSGIPDPIWDMFNASVGTFASADEASVAAEHIADQIAADLDRTWDPTSFASATAPGLQGLKQFKTGNVDRRGTTYAYSWLVVASGPAVGVFYGLSSWYFTSLEVAFLASVFDHLASLPEASDAKALLPAAENLTAGVMVSD